jgi:hypothetical protein
MLKLDHPDIEPFEPLISNLMDHAFGDALRGLAVAGLRPSDEWHTEAGYMFKAACLPGFKRCQIVAGKLIVDLEKQIRSLGVKESEHRAKRDTVALSSLREFRGILQNRQLVLRRLIDAMLYLLIWPHYWILRRLRVEGGIKRVDPCVVEPLLEVVASKHSEVDEAIDLICDLTTVAQIGDLIMSRWNPAANDMKTVVAELKVGPMNQALYNRLHDPTSQGSGHVIAQIAQELGPTAARQATRMARQEARLNNFTRVLETDEGIGPTNGRPYRMTRASAHKDYRDEIESLVAHAKAKGHDGLTIDKCLHLLVLIQDGQSSSDNSLTAVHSFHHRRKGGPCKLDGPKDVREEEIAAIMEGPKAVDLFNVGMRSSIALPPLLWYPRSLMLDVLMGRIKVFAQLDHDKFFELASRSGLTMRFIQGNEAAKIRSAKLSGPLIEYRDPRFVKVENAQGKTMHSGARFFSRVYLDLTRPHDLLAMAEDLMEEASKREPPS